MPRLRCLELDPLLVEVGEILLEEAQTAGILAASAQGGFGKDIWPDEEMIIGVALGPPYPLRMQAYLEQRFRQFHRFFACMENLASVTISTPTPRSYTFGTWPPDLSIAATEDDLEEIPPSQLLMTLVDHWEAIATGNTTYLRLLRSSLYVLSARGMEAAIKYLLDLQAGGASPSTDSLTRVVRELVWARAVSDSDEDAVQLLLQGPLPTSHLQWQSSISSLPDVPETMLGDWPQTLRKLASHVLERVVREIKDARGSSNYDDWLVQRALTTVHVNVLLWMLGPSQNLPLTLRGLVSQLEEILVDGQAIMSGLRVTGNRTERAPGLAGELRWVRDQILPKYLSDFPDDGLDRVFRERLVAPSELGAGILTSDYTGLPEQWAGLSWRLAHPFTALFRPAVPVELHRNGLFDLSEIVKHPLVTSLLGDTGPSDLIRRLQLAYVDDSLPPGDPSFPAFRQLVRMCHIDLAQTEVGAVLSASRTAIDASRYNTALGNLKKAILVYPWNADIYYELARCYYLLSNRAECQRYLVPAVALRPDHPQALRLMAALLSGESDTIAKSGQVLSCLQV
jgi:hypothetical protein